MSFKQCKYSSLAQLIENIHFCKKKDRQFKIILNSFMHIELILNSSLIISFATTSKF